MCDNFKVKSRKKEQESERDRQTDRRQKTDRQTEGERGRERQKCNPVVLYIQPHLTTTK